jgi:4-amino-4-deoxy-L-arabinose transferase-like glycosyltransferase
MLPESVQPLSARAPSTLVLRSFIVSQWQVIVLGCLVLVAALVRIVDVTEVPKGFFTDEASFGLNADLILHTGRDEHGEFLPLLFKSFGEYKLPVFIYLEVPFMAVFGRTEEAVRLTAAVAGTLTVVTTYLLTKELFKHELAALASAGFLAILPWHIHYSRTGLGDIVVLPLFFTLGFYLFFRAMRDYRYLIPAAAVLALCFYCYRGGWLVVPPLLLLIAVAYRKALWAIREVSLLAGGVFLVILAPLAYHLLFANADRSSQAWIFNIDDPNRGTFELFTDFYRSYYTRSFLFDNGDNGFLLRHFLPGQGWLYYIQAPLLLAGIVAMLLKLNRRYLFVLLLLLIYPLTASVSDTSPISSRAILGSVAMALTSGIGAWAVVNLVSKLTPLRYQSVAAGATVAVIAAVSLHSFVDYENNYFDNYARLTDGYWGWQDGPQEIIAYFLTVEGDYDQLIMSGDFNAPAIFFRFYAGDDGCNKCFIGGPDDYRSDRRQLFALKPEALEKAAMPYRTIDNVLYRDGSIAFQYVVFSGPALQSSGGAR